MSDIGSPARFGISRHFRREAVLMLVLGLAPVVLGLLGAFVLPFVLSCP